MAADTILVRLRAIGAKRFTKDMDDAGGATGRLGDRGHSARGGLDALSRGSVNASGAVTALGVVCGIAGGAQAMGLLIAATGAAVIAVGALGIAAVGALGTLALFAAGAVAWFNQMKDVGGSAASGLAADFTNFKTVVAQELGPAFDPVFKALGQALTPLAGLVRSIAPAFRELGTVIAGAVRPMTDMVVAMGPKFSQLIRATGPLVQALVPLFGQLLRVFLTIAISAMPYLVSGIQKLTGWLSRLSDGGITGAVGSAFQTLGDVFRTVVAIIRLVGPVFGAIADGLRQIAQGALPGVVQGIKNLTPAFEAIVQSGALRTLASAIGTTFGVIATVVGKVATELQKYGLLKPVIVGIAAAFVAWKVAVIASNIALAANPVVLIIAAIAALAVGVVYAYRRFEGFRNAVDTAWGILKSVFGWVRDNWQLVLGLLTGPVGLAVGFVIRHFGSILDFVKGLPGKIGGLLKGIGGILIAPFKMAFNGIASLWNNTLGKISFKIPGWVPGVGGKGFSFPQIPMLAEGGTITSPGMALVGEQGPELVTLGAGATVHPAGSAATRAATAKPGTSGRRTTSTGVAADAKPRYLVPVNLVMPNGRQLATIVAEAVEDENAGIA